MLCAIGVAFGAGSAYATPRVHDRSLAVPGSQVRGLSLAVSAKGAALTVEMSRRTSFKIFALENPYRVVVDLRDTARAHSAHLPPAEGVIERVRSGARPHGTLRLVLELKSVLPAQARWSASHRGEAPRLIVTLGSGTIVASNEAPAASEAPSAHEAPAADDAPAAHEAPAADDAPAAHESSVAASEASESSVSEIQTPAGSARALVKSNAREHPVRAVHAPADSDRDVVVAVDPGHGGQDSGAIGRGGIEEKNVVLAIAIALADRIDAEPGMRAVLTRDRDEFLPLRERMRRARLARADLFVSIHADSIHDSHISGSSVYVLSERGATDEAARWLAERENASDLVGGVSLADKDSRLASVLLDLSQSAIISASMTAAQRVLAALRGVGEVRKPQVQQAGFVVLKAPDVPSMLIETAYISNPADERRLHTASEQRKLAEAIFAGLRAYFEQYPPAGTRFAAERGTSASSAVLAGTSSAPAVSLAR